MKLVCPRYWLLATLTTLLLVMTVSVSAQANTDVAPAQSAQWLTYVDPIFGFSIEYPADWQVVPRNDASGIGGTLSFFARNTNLEGEDLHDSAVKVEIGIYPVPWSDRVLLPDRSLRAWVEQYNQISNVPGIEPVVEEARYMRVSGRRAFYQEGHGYSPYAYVSVPRGDVVWFIWSNAEKADNLADFNRMLRSFRFSRLTPMTLQKALGNDFKPSRLSSRGFSSGSIGDSGNSSISPMVSSSWTSPLRGSNLTTTCNSAAHGPNYGGTNQGKSEYAIDVAGAGIVEWVTPVYASRQGTIRFAGWNTNGFGNLVKLERDSLTAFTAHLAGIHESIYTGKYVNVGTLLGWVGKSGNATGVHLHFEIRDTSPHSVSLVGMTGFSANTYYPYPGAPNTGICGSITY